MEREIVEPRNQVRATLKRTDQRVATRSSAQPVKNNIYDARSVRERADVYLARLTPRLSRLFLPPSADGGAGAADGRHRRHPARQPPADPPTANLGRGAQGAGDGASEGVKEKEERGEGRGGAPGRAAQRSEWGQ